MLQFNGNKYTRFIHGVLDVVEHDSHAEVPGALTVRLHLTDAEGNRVFEELVSSPELEAAYRSLKAEAMAKLRVVEIENELDLKQ